MKHVNIIVQGIVQGVGFRFSARHMANSLGVKGFVKNLPNGEVYLEAEGNEAQVNEFVKWCKKGPSSARVRNAEVHEGEYKGYRVFDVK